MASTPFKGRGSASNAPSRYMTLVSERVADGWWQESEPDAPPTTLVEERGKTIISSNDSPDLSYRHTINPYRGCEHGCIYCYARPSHAYWDLSPGLDFETHIVYKSNAPELLRATFERSSYRCAPVSIGANTDPYQPAERKLRITRRLLEVCSEYRHPVSLITKSAAIQRDLDLLAPLAAEGLCAVAVSVTTLDNELKRILEPRTAAPEARLETIAALSDAGIPVTLMVAPIIPAINDSEMERIVEAGKTHGAERAHYILLRLPGEVAALFEEWLTAHFSRRAAHVMSLVRQSRGGRDNDPRFFKRFTGTGVFADLLRRRFEVVTDRLSMARSQAPLLATGRFRRPSPQGDFFGGG